MPNAPEMSKFLYTIVKQLDLKSIDWNQISSELGITNGHAARMRYSRFKQQMEGNTPIRRTRGPMKRPPKHKRSKDEDNKDLPKVVKLESSPASFEHMPSSSPAASNFGASQGSQTLIMPESVVVKSEPQEDLASPETSLALNAPDYTHPSMSMQQIDLQEQVHQPRPILAVVPSNENLSNFNYEATQAQIQHHQRMYHQMSMPQVHAMMGQDMNQDIYSVEPREYSYSGMDIFAPVTDVGGCHGQMMVSMVKAEGSWDPSYGS